MSNLEFVKGKSSQVETIQGKEKEKKSFIEKIKALGEKRGKLMLAAFVFAAASLAPKSGAAQSGEGGKDKNTTTVTYINEGKVDKNNIPSGFSYDRTENGKNFYKKTENKTIKEASGNKDAKFKPGMTPDYKNWLISQLESGVSPDELIKKGYATSDGLSGIMDHYNPTVREVYTEDGASQNHFESKASYGESVFNSAGHRIGAIKYNTVSTDNINDAGNLNTATQSATITFLDDFGNVGGQITIPGSEVQNYMGTTHHINDPDKLQELIAKAKAASSGSDVVTTGK